MEQELSLVQQKIVDLSTCIICKEIVQLPVKYAKCMCQYTVCFACVHRQLRQLDLVYCIICHNTFDQNMIVLDSFKNELLISANLVDNKCRNCDEQIDDLFNHYKNRVCFEKCIFCDSEVIGNSMSKHYDECCKIPEKCRYCNSSAANLGLVGYDLYVHMQNCYRYCECCSTRLSHPTQIYHSMIAQLESNCQIIDEKLKAQYKIIMLLNFLQQTKKMLKNSKDKIYFDLFDDLFPHEYRDKLIVLPNVATIIDELFLQHDLYQWVNMPTVDLQITDKEKSMENGRSPIIRTRATHRLIRRPISPPTESDDE